MWMINPEMMCKRHILGEHAEIHKHRHIFVKHHSIDGRVAYPAQISPHRMKQRHDELAQYILNHNSPYEQPDLTFYGEQANVEVEKEYNMRDLYKRCKDCMRLKK